MAATESVEIGVIGGIGQQSELPGDWVTMDVRTPYGATSVPVQVGAAGGKRVAFIPRRGRQQVIQPHLVPYRANIWALASLGARVLISTTPAGGLRDSFSPGTFVVPDQLIDATSNREFTFYDEGPGIELAAADPFDPTLRGLAVEALSAQGVRYRDFGTAVVVNGPRFSTRAESRMHAAGGGDLVLTTLMPETTLAMELGMAVANVSLITDSDAFGSDLGEAVSADLIRRRVLQAFPVISRTVAEIVRTIPKGFRPATGIPAAAIESVLARDTR